MLTARLSAMFVAAFAPMLLYTPHGPIDARRRYHPPHRPVGSVKRGRARRMQPNGGLALIHGRIEVAPHRAKLSGARGLR